MIRAAAFVSTLIHARGLESLHVEIFPAAAILLLHEV
jgi:hypothetical protein